MSSPSSRLHWTLLDRRRIDRLIELARMEIETMYGGDAEPNVVADQAHGYTTPKAAAATSTARVQRLQRNRMTGGAKRRVSYAEEEGEEDGVDVQRARRSMENLRAKLIRRHLLMVDVEYDGSCAVWSVLPAFADALGRPTTKKEVREILISIFRLDSFRPLFEIDLRQTNSERAAQRGRRLPPLRSVNELIDTLAVPDAYLPPILVARATEFYTRGRVRVFTVDNDNDLIELFTSDGDAPYVAQIAFEPNIGHVCRVLSLPRSQVISMDERKRNLQMLDRQIELLSKRRRLI